MHNWSVLNNSIRDFTDIPFDKRIHWSFVGTEISNIMRQLEGVHTQEELYDWAAFHQQWHGPTTNKIFFSLLNTLRSRFGDFYIDMLIDIFSEAAYIAQDDRHRKESDYVKLIEHGFSDIFPEFDFVKREAVFQSFRVDLLAMDSTSNKSVLFEVKLGADDPTAQLLRYSSFFSNPILIGITEKRLPCQGKHPKIHYYTYSDLNQKAVKNLRTHFSQTAHLFPTSPLSNTQSPVVS